MSARIQYTIRGIPPEVDRTLRERAHQNHESLNEYLSKVLTQAAHAPARPVVDIVRLRGKFLPDPEFEAALADFKKIDDELWK